MCWPGGRNLPSHLASHKEGKPSGDRARFSTPLPPGYAGGIDKEGGDHLKQWVEQGGVVLIGLRAQHRAHTHHTFKLPFNSLHLLGLQRGSVSLK